MYPVAARSTHAVSQATPPSLRRVEPSPVEGGASTRKLDMTDSVLPERLAAASNPNLARAWGWATLKHPVFPLNANKTPKTHNGFKDATTDLRVIQTYWTACPDDLVGVVTGDTLNVLDIDVKHGSNGFDSLTGTEIPDTWSQDTPSGGRHYVYRGQPGLGPTRNHNGLAGVDRRAGGSYFVAYADDVPHSGNEFKTPPKFLVSGAAAPTESAYAGTVATWLSDHDGEPGTIMLLAMQGFPAGDFGHAEMCTRQTELVILGAEGHAGATIALAKLRSLWLAGPYDTPEHESEWNDALAGAITKFGGSTLPPITADLSVPWTDEPVAPPVKVEDEVDELELATRVAYLQLKAKQNAERLVAAEGYSGSEELTWDDLSESQSSYIVQDLLPHDGVCFLIAKRNLGKTFCYIDMVLSSVFGMTWLGKATEPVKTTIVIGEGLNGYIDRMRAWLDYHGKAEAEAREWITFVRGANLMNDESVARVQAIADREGTGLIVWDTWANVSGLPDNDKDALVTMAMERALTIRSGATHLFVHHPRKSEEDTDHPILRGSGALDGRADVVMTMYRDRKFLPKTGEKADYIALSTDDDHGGKNRSAATETIQGLYLSEHNSSAVFRQVSSESMSKASRFVMDHLKGRMTAAEFETATGKTTSTATRYLKDAVSDGVALTQKHGNSAAVYWLVDATPKRVNYAAIVHDLNHTA